MKQVFNLLLIFVCVFSTTSNAQTPLPYYTGFDNATEKAGWTEFRKGDNGAYKWTFDTNSSVSSPTRLKHDYPVGGSVVTDDWFVSPPFSFIYGGKIDSVYSSFTGFGMPTSDDTIAIYVLRGNPDPALASSKTLILDYKTAYINDNTWRDTFSIAIPASPSTTFIAFRYKTINNWLDVSFDNLRLKSNAASSIDPAELNASNYHLYPNPCQDGNLFFSKEINAGAHAIDIRFYSIIGQEVCRLKPAGTSFKINLKNGIYLYSVYADGTNVQQGKLVVEH